MVMTRSTRQGLRTLAFIIGISVFAIAFPKSQDLDVAQRGASLRREINAAYADAKSRNAFVHGGYDVTSIVSKYIPAGTTFNEAEQVLRAAGCRVSAHSADFTRGGDSIDERIRLSSVVATRDMSRGIWDMGYSWAVSLSPNQPGDYDVVAKMSSSIVHIMS